MNSDAATTFTLGRVTCAVTPSKLGITLTGPRGGKLDGIRNVNDGTIYVLSGVKTVCRLSDKSGALVRID